MSQAMTIGALRHRVRIERQMRVPDGGGGADVTWAPVADVWASVKPRAADERVSHDRVAGHISHDIWLRFRADVRPAMRIRWGQRTFDIRGVMDFDDRQRWTRCVCEEIDL